MKVLTIIKKIYSVAMSLLVCAVIVGGVVAIMRSDIGLWLRYVISYGLILVIGVLIGFAIVLKSGIPVAVFNNGQESEHSASIGKTGKREKATTPSPTSTVTFSMVAGAEEEKAELQEIVDFLKHPEKFSSMNVRLPHGVLLEGSPGTGKTLLAQAVAGEAGVPFIRADASTFVELYVGVGAKRVRAVFDEARQVGGPCVVFIDEIDALGKKRSTGDKSDSEREQTLNQLLVEMDGFQKNDNIVVLAATNRIDVLDPALLRSGRFDRKITMSLPDIKGRTEILGIHAEGKTLADDVVLADIAKTTPGCSGADLAGIMNEAAILAIRHNHPAITSEDVNEAVKRVMYGLGKKSAVISKEDLYVTAVHEVGHAIVAHYTPDASPVHEISIIPRGKAMGYTRMLGEDVTSHTSKRKIMATIAVLLGGRVAERMFTGDVYTGAESDLKRASELAMAMLTAYGMSERRRGVVCEGGTLSDAAKCALEGECEDILKTSETSVEHLLETYRTQIERVVNELLEHEQISGDRFRELLVA